MNQGAQGSAVRSTATSPGRGPGLTLRPAVNDVVAFCNLDGGLPSHVADDARFLALVEEGKQALRKGRMVDHASVVAASERIVGPTT